MLTGSAVAATGWYALRRATRIELVRTGKDKFGRTLAHVIVDGKDLSLLLIEDGHGRPYSARRTGWCRSQQ